MRTWKSTAGPLLLATMSVYPASAVFAGDAVSAASHGSAADRQRHDAESSPPAPVIPPATQTSPDSRPPVSEQPLGSSAVNVADNGTVEIHVTDANLTEVLRMLSVQSQKNIIASKDVRGTITANLYNVTIHEALDAILRANGYDYREKGNFIYVYTAKELADIDKTARRKVTEVFRLYYTPAANAVTMVKPVMSAEGQLAFSAAAEIGISTDSKGGGNSHASEDLIVLTDYPENIDAARKVLKEVDRRPQQILIEATILKCDLNENNSLGIDFTALGGVNFGALSAANGSTPLQTTGLAQALTGDIASNPQGARIANRGYIAGSVGGSGLQLGIVKDSLGLFIQALEGVTDTVVLANPKVLVLNKQRGEVHVGEDQGYRTTITTETTTASNVQFLQTGTHLIFRPYIGDNGYIRLEIHPEDSSGTVDPTGVPSKSVTEITTNVMVKDGHTIVIGGLFRESTTRNRSQVPGLGSIPGIGAAFRQQTDTTTREEVIILLTPHVIKDENAYFAASEEELKDVERMRVGMRRGLMPWGRERLAETWYDGAVHEMSKEKPDPEKALFHLNCAINLNPNFSEAMELRSRISGREMQAVDNSTIRSFVKNQILAERGKRGNTPDAARLLVPVPRPATEPAVIDAPVKTPPKPEGASKAAASIGPWAGPDAEMLEPVVGE